MNRRQQIIELLTLHDDGLSIAELCKLTGADDSSMRAALRVIESVYIDRWRARKINRGSHNGHVIMWESVYCLHKAPPNAPKPIHQPTEDDLR